MPIPGTVQVTGPIAPTSTGDTFGTHYDIYGIGGLRVVADHATRNGLIAPRAVLDMIVVTQNDGFLWQLTTFPPTGADGDWTQFTGGGSGANNVVNGRLTTQSGVPVSFQDRISQTTLYWTPYKGNLMTLWDGSKWTTYSFSEITYALGTLTNATLYDVFAYQSSGAVTLDTPLAWRVSAPRQPSGVSNANPIVVTDFAHPFVNGDQVYISQVAGNLGANGTWIVSAVTTNTYTLTGSAGTGTYTSGTGLAQARTSSFPSIQDGRYCEAGDKTRLYLGTFLTTSTTTTEDSMGGTTTLVGGKRFVWNYYNRVDRQAREFDGTGSWTYSGAVWRQARATASNKVEFVCGIQEDFINATHTAVVQSAATTGGNMVGVGINTTTLPLGFPSGCDNGAAATNTNISVAASILEPLPPGYHAINRLEISGSTGTTFIGQNTTLYGTSGITAYFPG